MVESIPAARADPERLAASRQIGEGIKDCLSRLKRERRIAVTLYLQGHTVPESVAPDGSRSSSRTFTARVN